MYLHAIANSKNRLANSEYCWIKPGSIFCIHRIRPSRDDNSPVDLKKTVTKNLLIFIQGLCPLLLYHWGKLNTDSDFVVFCMPQQIRILSQLINSLLHSLISFFGGLWDMRDLRSPIRDRIHAPYPLQWKSQALDWQGIPYTASFYSILLQYGKADQFNSHILISTNFQIYKTNVSIYEGKPEFVLFSLSVEEVNENSKGRRWKYMSSEKLRSKAVTQ